ncbi:hypothetical protein P7C73_g6405, partial [Tremellales sp. Uapishka_1]
MIPRIVHPARCLNKPLRKAHLYPSLGRHLSSTRSVQNIPQWPSSPVPQPPGTSDTSSLTSGRNPTEGEGDPKGKRIPWWKEWAGSPSFQAALSTVVGLGLVFGAGVGYLEWYKDHVLRRMTRAFAAGYDPALELTTVHSPVSNHILRREQPLIDSIFRGEEGGGYYLMVGPKGTGKGTMVLEQVIPDFTLMFSTGCIAHPDLEVFRLRLGKALDFDYYEDWQGSLFSRADPRNGGPALDVERAMNKLEKVALRYTRKHGRPLVLCFNRCVDRMKKNASRMRILSVYDLSATESLRALKHLRKQALGRRARQGEEVRVEDESVLKRVYELIGGRTSYLARAARAEDMLAEAEYMIQSEKAWLLSKIGLIPEMDDDVMDEQKWASCSWLLLRHLAQQAPPLRQYPYEGPSYALASDTNDSSIDLTPAPLTSITISEIERELLPPLEGIIEPIPEDAEPTSDDVYSPRVTYEEARRIMTRADFLADLDHHNIVTIDVHHDVGPDSIMLLRAAQEVISREGFDKDLDQTRDRVDEIEGLHRQSELTVKEPFRVVVDRSGGRTVLEVEGLGGSFVPASNNDGDDEGDDLPVVRGDKDPPVKVISPKEASFLLTMATDMRRRGIQTAGTLIVVYIPTHPPRLEAYSYHIVAFDPSDSQSPTSSARRLPPPHRQREYITLPPLESQPRPRIPLGPASFYPNIPAGGQPQRVPFQSSTMKSQLRTPYHLPPIPTISIPQLPPMMLPPAPAGETGRSPLGGPFQLHGIQPPTVFPSALPDDYLQQRPVPKEDSPVKEVDLTAAKPIRQTKPSCNPWDYLRLDEEDDDEVPEEGEKKRRASKARRRFKPRELEMLELLWSFNTSPMVAQKQRLAAWFGVNTRGVTVWFQNRRQVSKRHDAGPSTRNLPTAGSWDPHTDEFTTINLSWTSRPPPPHKLAVVKSVVDGEITRDAYLEQYPSGQSPVARSRKASLKRTMSSSLDAVLEARESGFGNGHAKRTKRSLEVGASAGVEIKDLLALMPSDPPSMDLLELAREGEAEREEGGDDGNDTESTSSSLPSSQSSISKSHAHPGVGLGHPSSSGLLQLGRATSLDVIASSARAKQLHAQPHPRAVSTPEASLEKALRIAMKRLPPATVQPQPFLRHGSCSRLPSLTHRDSFSRSQSDFELPGLSPSSHSSDADSTVPSLEEQPNASAKRIADIQGRNVYSGASVLDIKREHGEREMDPEVLGAAEGLVQLLGGRV